MKNSLKQALPIVARYYCNNLGMRIEFGGGGAYHTPGLIGLPDLDDSLESTVMALGYIAHESAHEKFTDGLIVDHLPKDHPPFVKSLVNALEDIRIEGLMFKQHPATVSDLSVVARKVLGGVSGQSGVHCAAVLHNACLIVGRARLLGQPLQAEAQALVEAMKEHFGPGRTTKVFALLSKLPSLPGTKETADLGYAILDVLDEEEPEEGAPDPQGGTGGQQDTSAGTPDSGDQGTPSDDGRSDGDASSSDSGDQSADKQDPAPSQSGTGNGADASGGAKSDAGDGSAQSLKQQVLSAGADVLDGLVSDLGDEIAARLGDLKSNTGRATPASVVDAPLGSGMLGKDVVSAGQAASTGLRQVLMGLIQGTQNNRVETRRQGRSIDAKRLAQVRVGETRIFRKQEPVQSVNAAFEILLDGSISMANGDCMQRAEEATVAVLSALETVPHVTTGAMVFPRMVNHRVSVGVLKRHNQPLRVAIAENRFGMVAEGGTPLAEAIWPAAGDLLHAKGERKVMMVVTDGDPNNADEARHMVERCVASGIEVFAIAFGQINTSKLNAVYDKNWKFLASVNELRNALYEVVRNVLTNKAAA
ncbi:VWA domain-containing protein [Pseudomonas putida]|uniref:VWA domain-containing protein n=1 Tax=Pseudomonas putida TaxID=303 RepID=A0A7Y8D3Y1_PSEPU|nr:VWA domain-containing protein [Pseudomonas putida]NWC83840.1 VWA domain-containing protein [Pseudomonas putida]